MIVLTIVVLDIAASLYKSSILGGFFVSGTIPLFYELTVESTYPVAEGITTGLLTIINNSFTVIFLVILMVPGVGKFKTRFAANRAVFWSPSGYQELKLTKQPFPGCSISRPLVPNAQYQLAKFERAQKDLGCKGTLQS